MAETSLLEDLRDHLSPVLDLFPDVFPPIWRLHVFTDADLSAPVPVILLRRSGSGGDDDEIAQQTDVDVIMLMAPDQVKAGENMAHTLRLFLKSDAGVSGAAAYAYTLVGPIIGPVQLANGRHRFMFMVRCFTEDQ